MTAVKINTRRTEMVTVPPAMWKYLQYLAAHKVRDIEPRFVNAHQAAKRFGRTNVERWARNGRIKPYGRPKGIEYSMDELLTAAEDQQDYLYE